MYFQKILMSSFPYHIFFLKLKNLLKAQIVISVTKLPGIDHSNLLLHRSSIQRSSEDEGVVLHRSSMRSSDEESVILPPQRTSFRSSDDEGVVLASSDSTLSEAGIHCHSGKGKNFDILLEFCAKTLFIVPI